MTPERIAYLQARRSHQMVSRKIFNECLDEIERLRRENDDLQQQVNHQARRMGRSIDEFDSFV